MKYLIISMLILGALGIVPRSLLAQETEEAETTYVNKNSYWKIGDGSLTRPGLTVLAGMELTPQGGVISIAAGSYWESLEISRPLTLVATEGLVRILGSDKNETAEGSSPKGSFEQGNSFKFEQFSDHTLTVSPNPIGSEAEIRFYLRDQGEVQLQVFSPEGKQVALLFRGKREKGIHTLTWDGRDSRGNSLSPGVYILKLSAGSKVETFSLLKP
ncbi:MAG: FlgD immunoglobulin-like domain containing protein [Bacteroidota bacterium]